MHKVYTMEYTQYTRGFPGSLQAFLLSSSLTIGLCCITPKSLRGSSAHPDPFSCIFRTPCRPGAATSLILPSNERLSILAPCACA